MKGPEDGAVVPIGTPRMYGVRAGLRSEEEDRRIGARALEELVEAERAMDQVDGGIAAVDTERHPERIGERLADRIRRWAGGER